MYYEIQKLLDNGFYFLILFIIQQMTNKIRKQITIVAPDGRFSEAEAKSPVTEPMVLMMAEAISCCLKFL